MIFLYPDDDTLNLLAALITKVDRFCAAEIMFHLIDFDKAYRQELAKKNIKRLRVLAKMDESKFLSHTSITRNRSETYLFLIRNLNELSEDLSYDFIESVWYGEIKFNLDDITEVTKYISLTSFDEDTADKLNRNAYDPCLVSLFDAETTLIKEVIKAIKNDPDNPALKTFVKLITLHRYAGSMFKKLKKHINITYRNRDIQFQVRSLV